MRDRRFCFHDLIQETTIHANIHIHNILRRPGKRQTSKLDRLIVMTIAQVPEMQNIFPPEKTIYQIHHPEERVYIYPDIFEELRRSFTGRIIAISPWTAEQVWEHIPTPPVVPDVVSNAFWDPSNEIHVPQRNKDILFHFSLAGHKGKDFGEKLLTTLGLIRPGTRCTVWSRDGVPEDLNSPVVKNISESALRDLYLSHKMLLFPSTFEGFGMPPIEAMACGCIPIQYPGIGASDLYSRDGITSVFIHDNIKKTAKRIAALLDDNHLLGKMRIAARDAVEPFAPEGYGIRLLLAAGVDVEFITKTSVQL